MICYSYLCYFENQKKKAVYALQYQELTYIMKCHLAVFYPQVSMFWESHGAKAGNKFFHISIGHGTCYQPTCQSKGTCLFAPEIKTKNCTKVAVDPKWFFHIQYIHIKPSQALTVKQPCHWELWETPLIRHPHAHWAPTHTWEIHQSSWCRGFWQFLNLCW